MTAIILVIAIVAVCVLGAVFGVDSRPVERGPHRPNWR
jgi:hypothetical protein